MQTTTDRPQPGSLGRPHGHSGDAPAPVGPPTDELFAPPSRRGWRGAVRRTVHHRGFRVLLSAVVVVMVSVGALFGYLTYLNASAPPPLSFADAPSLATGSDRADAATAPSGSATSPDSTDLGVGVGRPGAAGPSPTAGAAPGAGATRTAEPAPTSGASEVEGRWVVGPNSLSGYRIGYSAVGVRGTRVGRTNAGDGATTGEFHIAGTVLQSAEFSVEMSKVECDGGSSCTDHVNEMMDVANHPFETFVLSQPVDLGSIPPDGKQIAVRVSGKLTLRGVTRSVTFPLSARRNGGRIEVLGTIPVNRDDYRIPDANEPGFSVDKDGVIELLLVFDRG